MTDLPFAHQHILEVADELQLAGEEPDEIIDALLFTAVNAGVGLIGMDRMATLLEQTAARIRAGESVTKKH